MLDLDSAVPFLLEHGLAERDWIVEGTLTIRSAARRNRNLMVQGPAGTGVLLKQCDGLSPASALTLRNEARFYEFCRQEPAAEPVSRFLPRLRWVDPQSSGHALELIPGARTLLSHQAGPATEKSLEVPSRALGRALGTLHRVFRQPGLNGHEQLAWLERPIPWAFTAHRRPTPGMLLDLSPAGATLFRLVRSEPGLDAALERTAALWREETVLHGDLKADNVLVGTMGTQQDDGDMPIWLVDWEFVHRGDPAWDLASALHDFLMLWTASMPQDPSMPVSAMADQATRPLAMLRPAILALWRGYLETAELGASRESACAEALLRRAVVFSGARLIQAAHELSLEQERLTTQAVLLLQLGVNVLADPAGSQLQLYGIPAEHAGS